MLNKKCILIIIFIIFSFKNFLKPKQTDVVDESSPQQEEFLPEEEQLLLEEYEQLLDQQEQETTFSTTKQDLDLFQEDEGFLENLLKNPLDLNTATYTELKSLPGMTSEVARQIIRQRRIQPFKSKKEIKKLRGVDDEFYNKISAFITVRKIKQPKKFKGQVRLRLRQDEVDTKELEKVKYLDKDKFNQPIYFYNRTYFSYGDNLSLGYTFLHRPMEIEINQETFGCFLRKWWIKLNSLGPFDKILLGDYKAGFGYGLIFNENYYISGSLWSVKPKMRGLREDKSSYDNTNFYGIGFESHISGLEYAIFYSQKELISKTSVYYEITTDETSGEEKIETKTISVDDLLELRKQYIEYNRILMDYDINIQTSTVGKLPQSKIQEKLFGINFSLPLNILKLGFCGYYAEYDKVFDPITALRYGLDKYSDKWGNVYRGDRLAVGSLYFDLPLYKFNLYGEIAKTNAYFEQTSTSTFSQQGFGLNLGLLLPAKNKKFYFLYTYLSPKFYSPFGKSFTIYDYPNNQQTVKFGSEYSLGNLDINFSYTTAEIFESIWSGSPNSESPRYPSKYDELFFETKYKLVKNVEFYFRNIDTLKERYINLKTYNISQQTDYVQTQQLKINNRYQISYNITKDISLRCRFDQQFQKFIKYNVEYYGEQLWAEVKYKIYPFTINSRFCVFETDKNIYLSYLDPSWYNVYIVETENNSFGDKFYFTISTKLFKKLVLWSRYRYKYYLNSKKFDNEFRFQLDFNF
ncbi:MAG: ComEA family DNA-binding protein [Endomicrobiia bacterium]